MKVFADSSALVKHYIEEAGSERIARALHDASALGVSVICLPEVISALNRRRRDRDFTPHGYGSAKKALLDDLKDAEVIQITPEVSHLTIRLLETHALRAMDALHVSCALAWRAERFLSSDMNQLRAASAEGLNIVGIRSE